MKPKTLRFRVSNSEYYIIKNKAKQAGITISEYVRSRALDYDLTYKLTEEEIIVYKQLNSFSDHFRRISNLFKLGDITKVKEVSVETAELIRKHLEKLKK
ncbi:plasmid mobilization protein [Empedobacter sp. ULE_I140]